MAFHLSSKAGARVLVVDLDPQCNATQLLLDDEQWQALFGSERAVGTVLHVLRSIRRGDSNVETDYETHRSARFAVDVLAGHPSLALVEDTFSSSWEALLRGDLGGMRRSHWLRSLLARLPQTYDFVLVDAGPSLGALNRTVLLGVDLFVTPTSADMFSVFAIDNIRTWIKAWGRKYRNGVELVAENFNDDIRDAVPGDIASMRVARYLGFTIQQYVTKAMQNGERRGTNAYDTYRRQIPKKAAQLAEETGVSGAELDLGVVPYMFAMVPLAQASHSPISTLTSEDGLRGAQFSQQEKYRLQLEEIGNKLLAELAGRN